MPNNNLNNGQQASRRQEYPVGDLVNGQMVQITDTSAKFDMGQTNDLLIMLIGEVRALRQGLVASEMAEDVAVDTADILDELES